MIGKAETKPTSSTVGDIAEPEPEQEQRRIGDAGDRRADADQRQEDVLGPPRAAHGDADRDADDRGEREAGDEAQQRIEHVVRQDAGGGQADEGRGDLLERRKQLRGKMPSMRGDLPDRADHQERKRVARDDAPAAFARAAEVEAARTCGETVGAASAMGHDSAGAPCWTSGDVAVLGITPVCVPDERGDAGVDPDPRARPGHDARACVPARGGAWICAGADCYDRHAIAHMHGMPCPTRCRTADMPKVLVAALAMAGTLAAGIAGGFAARYAHLPLPWLLGALFAIMALSLAGVPVRLHSVGPAGGHDRGRRLDRTAVHRAR